MNTVFVVSEGDYSDRHICGIFSTKEKADRFTTHFTRGDYDPYDTQEWPLDQIEDKVYDENLHYYLVFMEKDGKAQAELWESYIEDSNEPPIFLNNKGQPEILRVFCWARSPEHAIKITNEKRAIILANNIWMNNEMVKNI